MYDLGDVVSLRVEVKDEEGNLANAGAITLTITLPDGTITEPTPSSPSIGVYEYDYLTIQEGRHLARWVATGANASAFVETFDVRPAEWPALISLADAKAQLNISPSYVTHDEEIRSYIESATAVIEGYVGAVVRRTVVQTVTGRGPTIVLHTTPVLSVIQVEEDGEVLDDVFWSINIETGILTRLSGDMVYPWGQALPDVDNVIVTYVAGREVVPANHGLAARMIVQHLWESQRGSVGTSKFGGSTVSTRYGGVDDVLIQPGFSFSIPRRAVELLERDMLPSGIA